MNCRTTWLIFIFSLLVVFNVAAFRDERMKRDGEQGTIAPAYDEDSEEAAAPEGTIAPVDDEELPQGTPSEITEAPPDEPEVGVPAEGSAEDIDPIVPTSRVFPTTESSASENVTGSGYSTSLGFGAIVTVLLATNAF